VTRRAALGVLAAVLALSLPGSLSAHAVKDGGTLRIAFAIGAFGSIDPAFWVVDPSTASLMQPTCGSLMAYPDKPFPEGRHLAPSLAESEPTVSRNRKTYRFTVRKDVRFSDGAPVTPRSFVRALERILTPAMQADAAGLFDFVVGAREMVAGKAATLAGVSARGRTLTVRLKRPVPNFLDLMTTLCAVPPSLPADPEGAKAPVPSAAPYYAAEYIPGERLVLERNRFYRGERPHHVARFVAGLAADRGTAVDEVASGAVETVLPGGVVAVRSAELARRYGVNKSQFFVTPGAGVRVFVLNTSRPLFRNNLKLRQAINFAVDRVAIAREDGAWADTPTDQFLYPGIPGYRNARIYPLRPDLSRARSLARGRTRGAKAVLYTIQRAEDIAQAQILQQNLKAIGLDLEIKFQPDLFGKLATPGEPFDIGRIRWFFADPVQLSFAFDGRTIGHPGFLNFSYFNSPKYNRLLERASRLSGAARYEAYGKLDVQLSRDAAPAIPVAALNALSFVSSRVGCVVVNPFLDLTAVCLK
jgi:ABC-type transport system substrate-binding protein